LEGEEEDKRHTVTNRQRLASYMKNLHSTKKQEKERVTEDERCVGGTVEYRGFAALPVILIE
jgi:hypothetical protein